jgi:2-hydroxychromene-2-carboxylate isomerase
MTNRLVHYFDYKSPYAYLAQEETFALSDEIGAELQLVPYTLHIPSFAGFAELDEAGRVLVDERNPHQWRRIHYAYMDCRREAQRRGIVLRGPRRIFDSAPAHIGFLFAQEQSRDAGSADWRGYHDLAFERFFRREFDPGDLEAVERLLGEGGLKVSGFTEYATDEGARLLARLSDETEAAGVFGVPSYRVGSEIYWGAERLPRVREALTR